MINGPIAAGKSTVAQALGQRLRQDGHPAAVVDLDDLYLMMSAKPMGDSRRPEQLVATILSLPALSDVRV